MALNQMSHFISPLKIFSTDPVQKPKSQHVWFINNLYTGQRANWNANLWKVAYRFAGEAAVKSPYLKPKFELDWFETNCWESMLEMFVVKSELLLCCSAFTLFV